MTDYQQYLTPDAIVLYPNRAKLVLLTVGGVVMMAASYFAWNNAEEIEYRVAGVAGLVFFGFCLLYFLLRFVKPKPSLIITDFGIVDDASALAAGLIRWDEIDNISIATFQRQRFLAVKLKDTQEFLSRQPYIKSRMMRMNISLAGTPVCIPGTSLPMTLEELLQTIQKKQPKSSVA
jgi:hypothetical protein